MSLLSLRGLVLLAISGLLVSCETGNPCAKIQCDKPRVCNPDKGTCELPAGYDAGLPPDAGAECPSTCVSPMVCNRATGECVQCLSAANCACPTPLCVSNVCQADLADAGAIAAADTCAGATTAVACGPKAFDVDVDLASMKNELQTTCAAPDAGGNDAVFNLTLGTASDVRVTVSSGGGSSVPVVALRTACGDTAELACANSQGASGSFLAHRLQEGTYAFVVQGYDRSGSGPTRAHVEVLPPTGSTNETCLQAQPLALDGGTTRVELAGADDDGTVSCNATPASPDLFYRFSLAQAGDVVIDAVTTAPQQPVLALWKGTCRAPASLACIASPGTVGRLIARRLEPGDYVVVAETPGPATMGRLELTATLSAASVAPSNDTCALPRELTFTNNEAISVTDTTLGNDDSNASCGGLGGPDLVYRLTVPFLGTYTFTATPEPGSGGVPVISLRADCAAAATSFCAVAQALNQPASFQATLAPGTYFVWLDATSAATAGRVTLTVRR